MKKTHYTTNLVQSLLKGTFENLSARLIGTVTVAVAALSIGYSPQARAWIQTGGTQKEYSFKYEWRNQTFETRKPASSYEEAFEVAAQECFRRFKADRKVSFTEGQDIIDVCANPR